MAAASSRCELSSGFHSWAARRPGCGSDSVEVVLEPQQQEIDARVRVADAGVRQVLEAHRDVVALEAIADAELVAELEARAQAQVAAAIRAGKQVAADPGLD